ncbi:hypothetical protein PCG10_001457 [Penicillium crustosum]|uniref:Calcium channel YVC1-like C-terminal transmembrane domain-containing protein n=1 Tax=Penicillium crustosum TaxID=36656 RepID=A0A9P5GP70_PENCR|nr:uncharacterized protein N7487_001981 [Penicillium crustosum]KAF7528168.1 hypothetical protein PCG10_001457 [Penicillium crustosum]KAJ5418431.1 hypothetical protein N7487_001981 [Penicillium crustosum]
MDTHMDHTEIPVIETDEPLFDVLPKLFNFISMAVGDMAYSFEQMLYGSQGHRLRQLVHALADDTHNPFIIVALMILKWDFTTATEDDWGLNESRGAACEFVAWQFLCHLNQRETIEFLLEELPTPRRGSVNIIEPEAGNTGLASIRGDTSQTQNEATPLLPNSSFYRLFGKRTTETQSSGTSQDTQTREEIYAAQRYSQFFGLNALEIATIAHAKRFLSQRVVQKVVDGIWNGEIVFWDSLTVNSTKKPHIFNRRTSDPYSRLRVPLYRKIFEAAFFMSFLFLYYAVLVERRQEAVGIFEAVMYVWIVAFAYDELSGIIDAGVVFYQMDFWSLWNLSIIGVGIAFVITRVIGLAKGNDPIIELSFDILSLEALFLVPRICSLVSLNSYFGSLISPIFGYGLMLTFALMTNTLILSSLISLMSMSLEGVMRHAREEYLFQLAIYVLESSNSRRLTYFMPPLNLIPLLCIRPMRLFLSAGTVRRVRIVLLRATHLPFVALIWAYESKWRQSKRQNSLLPPISARQGISENPTGPRCQDPHHPSVIETSRLGPGKAPSVDQQAARELDMGQFGQVPQLADLIDTIERLRTQVDAIAQQK